MIIDVLAQPKIQSATILDQIGNTPLLDLSTFAHARGVAPAVGVYAKAEWHNPGGSVKARAAVRMVEEAERSGELQPGKIIIDSSSGNTGIALALIGAVKGYAVHLVMPANVSIERKALVKAYGAHLIESDPLEGSDGAIELVRSIVASDPGRYFYINQYNNPANWLAHYEGTGPEIWQQTGGEVTHFVAGLRHHRHLYGHRPLSQAAEPGDPAGGRAAGGRTVGHRGAQAPRDGDRTGHL